MNYLYQILSTALLLLPHSASSQCFLSRITEYRGVYSEQGGFITTDSIVIYFDGNGDLIRSESHLEILSGEGIRFIAYYEAEGDQVIKEKVVSAHPWFIMEMFIQTYPGASCQERLCVDEEGNILLKEDMSEVFYGMKNWEGVDSEGLIYAKYQSGNNQAHNPELFYRYRDIDGVWETDVVTVLEKNEKGDIVAEMNIQVAGFGSHKEEFDYEYDKCGNWITKMKKGVSGKWHVVAMKRIIYSD